MLQEMTRRCGGRLPQLVAFDLDGTLVDSVPDLATATDRMLQALGREPAGEAQVRGWVGNGAAMLVRRALAGSAEPERVATVTEPLLESALNRFREYYAAENGLRSTLYPGVTEVLALLREREVPLVVITNKPKPFADPLLEKLDIARYFQQVLGGECLPRRKPDPLPLQEVAGPLGLIPARCLMVGDSRNDVEAARAAGWVSVALTYGYNHGEPVANCGPDWLLEDFRELIL